MIFEPKLGHALGIVQVPPVEDERLRHRGLHASEVRTPVGIPLGVDDQGAGTLQGDIIVFDQLDTIAEAAFCLRHRPGIVRHDTATALEQPLDRD